MGDCVEFGKCLNALLSALNIRSSRLAKGINIDASLVNRWIHGSRIPAYNSNYVELIADYICSNILNSFQEETLHAFLDLSCYSKKYDEKMSICEKIRFVLTEAQGYSIETQKKTQSGIKPAAASKDAVSRFFSKYTANNEMKPENIPVTYGNSSANGNTPGLITQPKLFSDYTNIEVKLITGYKEVLQGMLTLLHAASQLEANEKEPILITLNSDIFSLPACEQFLSAWEKELLNVLNNGWKVVCLIRIDNNNAWTMKIVHSIQSFLGTGNYIPYYLKKYSLLSTGREMLVVPGIGAILTFPAESHYQEASAVYFADFKAIEMLSKNFYYLISMALPLIQQYPPEKHFMLIKVFTEYEEKHGNKYLYKEGISSLTVPLDTYERYMRTISRPIDELSVAVELHKKRYQSFVLNIKHYKQRDIYTKESIERLVHEQKYSLNDLSLLGKCKPTKEYIIEHINNTIYLLEKYENYEIAIINEDQFNCNATFIWMVKGKVAVLWTLENKRYKDCQSNDRKISISIEEPTIVNAFEEYFMDFWSNIAPLNKDKKEVIAWLKSQIDILESL
jgi:hypothetical protein